MSKTDIFPQILKSPLIHILSLSARASVHCSQSESHLTYFLSDNADYISSLEKQLSGDLISLKVNYFLLCKFFCFDGKSVDVDVTSFCLLCERISLTDLYPNFLTLKVPSQMFPLPRLCHATYPSTYFLTNN